MQSTLSQAPPESAAVRRAKPTGPVSQALVSTLAILLALACNRVDHGVGASAADPVATPTSESLADADFEWPSDETHPRLAIEIRVAEQAGTIVVELMPELASDTVARVVALAEDGYYDGTTFHRVVPGFMIQGGDPNSRDRDPNNDGLGDYQLLIDDEFSPAPFLRGVVGLGNMGRANSTSGQFFIMHADNRSLDGRYTAIGRVVSGMDLVDVIAGVSTDRIGRWGPRDRPIANVLMTRVAVTQPDKG